MDVFNTLVYWSTLFCLRWSDVKNTMITPEKISRKQAKRLVKLLEREVRCEIMARYGEWGKTLEYMDYALKQTKYRNKILEHVFGTSNLVELGVKWKMLNTRKRKKDKDV